MLIENTPVIGGTAPRHATRTAQRLSDFALRHLDHIQAFPRRERYLDVGCGNGFITERVASEFSEVMGIDVEAERLEDFREYVRDQPKFRVALMSADRIEFPDGHFTAVTCFEVLEHVPDLAASVAEIVRVARPGGLIVISVPQVWFPFENHGVLIRGQPRKGKVFGLPYFRPLHKRYAAARVFSSGELDRLFRRGSDTELVATGYASPQLERSAARAGTWESRLIFMRGVLDRCEKIPVLKELTGVSILKAYRKR